MVEQNNIPGTVLFNMNNLHLPFSYGDAETLIEIGQKNPNSIILLIKLHTMSLIQRRTLIRCTKEILKKELGWGFSKIKDAKRVLVQHGIIKNITRRDKQNRIVFHAVQILKIKENPTGRYINPWGDAEPTVEKCVQSHIYYNEQTTNNKKSQRPEYQPYNNISSIYDDTKEGVCGTHPPSSKKKIKKSKRTKYPVQQKKISIKETLKLKYPLVNEEQLEFSEKVLDEINDHFPYSCNDTTNLETIFKNADVLRKIQKRVTAPFYENFKEALLWFPSSDHFWRDNLRCITTLTKKSPTTGIPKFEYLTGEYLKANPPEEELNTPFTDVELKNLYMMFNTSTADNQNQLQYGILSIIKMFHNIPKKTVQNNDIFKSRFPNGKAFVKEYMKYLHSAGDWLQLSYKIFNTESKLFNTYLKDVGKECMIDIRRFNNAD